MHVGRGDAYLRMPLTLGARVAVWVIAEDTLPSQENEELQFTAG